MNQVPDHRHQAESRGNWLLIGRSPIWAFWTLFLLLCSAPVSVQAQSLPDELADGFVVWESNRTGPWRIFMRPLSGTGEEGIRQVSPNQRGRNHYAVHISPDGSRIVYLSYPHGRDGYKKLAANTVAPMLIQDVAPGSQPRTLIANARPYGEHRCAMWLNDNELVYLDEHYYTRRLNLTTGQSERMTNDRPPGKSWDHGYLIDPTLRYATAGGPNFALYDQNAKTVQGRRNLGGCQPFITRDGEWGYWMAGMGGPIRSHHMATGRVGTILEKNDPRMPKGRSYLYFPFVSACRRLLVFSASPNQHDHHRSDYDLFAVPLNPADLSLAGAPMRLTTSNKTDRFPEVFIRTQNMELGRFEGKAPMSLDFTADQTWRGWTWTLDGRRSFRGASFSFRREGTYLIAAEKDGVVKQGQVVVHPPTPPELLSSALANDGRITLIFNEPVTIDRARFVADGTPLTGTLSPDSQSVLLALPRPPTGAVELRIDGVGDSAERPNVMRPATVRLEPVSWPVDSRGLVLAWETDDGVRALHRPNAATPATLELHPLRRARLTAHQAMLLDGGSFVASDAGGPLLDHFRGGREITIEAVVQSHGNDQRGPARIASFSSGIGSRNFTLGQERGHFVLRLRTPASGDNAVRPQLVLGPVDTTKPVHLVVTYKPGEMVAYIDGKQAGRSDQLRGGFENWSAHTLVFGDETSQDRNWNGTLEGFAIYNRFMEAEEVAANAEQARQRLAARAIVPLSVVRARLLAATPVPSLAEIEPYRSIMVVHEYELIETLDGPPPPKRFRVHHWGLLDGQAQKLPAQKTGDTAQLRLEPFAAHRHLQEIFPADTLETDLDAVLYLDVAR